MPELITQSNIGRAAFNACTARRTLCYRLTVMLLTLPERKPLLRNTHENTLRNVTVHSRLADNGAARFKPPDLANHGARG